MQRAPYEDEQIDLMSSGPTPTRDTILLREQEAEYQRLARDNFNQALRINFLEEQLLRLKEGPEFTNEDLEKELVGLRTKLEKYEQEFRARDVSMIRASEAMDMLYAQLQEAQAAATSASEAQRDAERRLQEHLDEQRNAKMDEQWRAAAECAINRQHESEMKVQEMEEDLQRQRDMVERLQHEVQKIDDVRHDLELQGQRQLHQLQQVKITNVKVTAEAEHWKLLYMQHEQQAKALHEQYMNQLDKTTSDRAMATERLNELEMEIRQQRENELQYQMVIKTLEKRTEEAEYEARRKKEECDVSASQCQRKANERLLALEKTQEGIEEDNRRLRTELAAFQSDFEEIERKYQNEILTAASNAQKERQHLAAYEEKLARQAKQLNDYQHELKCSTAELLNQTKRVQDLEHELTSVKSVKLHSNTVLEAEFSAEKKKLRQQVEEERQAAESLKQVNAALKQELTVTQRELEAVEVAICSALHGRNQNSRPTTVSAHLREAIVSLKNEFQIETSSLQMQCQQRISLMDVKLDRLVAKLRSNQNKLEVLQRSSVHIKDKSEKTWSLRYNELRLEKEEDLRSLEEEIRSYQRKASEAENALDIAKQKLEGFEQKERDLNDRLQRDMYELRETNRLLLDEVKERRRSAQQARKNHMQAVQENKDLLEAIKTYKDAISGRDEEIKKYKSILLKYSQKLKQRVDYSEVKHTLLEQLKQTQHLISETHKRLGDTSNIRGSIVSPRYESYEAVILQLDEYIGRVEIMTTRWSELVTQSQELQRRFGDSRTSASLELNQTKRQCSRLFTEIMRMSKAMRDAVNNISRVLTKERDENKQAKKDPTIAVDNNASAKRKEDRAKVSQLDGNARYKTRSSVESPVTSLQLNDLNSGHQSSPRASDSMNGLNGNSLSSLRRVALKVQELEKDIRNFRD